MLSRITLALIFAFAVIAAAPAFAKSKADECRPWDGDYHWICRRLGGTQVNWGMAGAAGHSPFK